MTLYSYIVANDTGFAPNPFHAFCTLACCKPRIRKSARKGDYVVGIGPKRLGNRVVYAMLVKETMGFDDYWRDPRFRAKRPDVEAGGETAVGDNIYHRDLTGRWQQERSQHSTGAIRTDTDGAKVLISTDFIYWGGDAPELPTSIRGIIPLTQGHRSSKNAPFVRDFIEWFESRKEGGRLGWPTQGTSVSGTSRKSKDGKRC